MFLSSIESALLAQKATVVNKIEKIKYALDVLPFLERFEPHLPRKRVAPAIRPHRHR